MKAKGGPRPRPGVLDITPYVPGKSVREGARPVIKLSSNETPFGPSPRAVEAYRAAADSLSRYPDGSARATRRSIASTASWFTGSPSWRAVPRPWLRRRRR